MTERTSYTPDEYFALADCLRAENLKTMFLRDRLDEIVRILGDIPATASKLPSRDPVYRAYSIADDALEQMRRDEELQQGICPKCLSTYIASCAICNDDYPGSGK